MVVAARLSVLVPLAALLTFAACGGSDDPSTPPPTDPPPVTPVNEGGTQVAPMTVAAPATVRIVRGQAVTARITIERNGREDAVTIEALDLPASVTADLTTVAPGQSSAEVTFRATEMAAFGGPHAFRVRATTQGDGAETNAGVVVAGLPGTLDTSFSFDGVATVRMTARDLDLPQSISVTPSGGVVVAGLGSSSGLPAIGYLLALKPDGELDGAFGTGGKILGSSLPGETESSYGSVAALPDGRVLAVVSTEVGPTSVRDVRRLLLNGSLDGTFGASGRLVLAGAGNIAIRPAGGFLMMGSSVSAFDANGAVDAGYGAGGTLAAPVPRGRLDSAGRLVACRGDLASDSVIIHRYTPAGLPDATFGDAGVATIAMPAPAYQPACADIVAQADGKLIAATSVRVDGTVDRRQLFLRLLENGAMDTSYGSAGFRFHGVSDGTRGGVAAAALQSDQKLLFFGANSVANTRFLGRYNPDGSTDTSFGGGTVDVTVVNVDTHELLRIDAVAGRAVVAGIGDASGGVSVFRYWL